MYNTQTINLDMSSRYPCPRVVAKQGDAGSREVAIKLYDNGAPANINNQIAQSGTETKGVVRFCKPDGKGGIYDRTEDNLIACTLGKDTITVRLAAQMLTCPGDVVADVAIICGTTIISTFNFIVAVQANPAAGITPSHSYYNYRSLADINQAINEAKAAAAGAVKFVNGVKPDTSGNVTVQIPSSGVTAVNGRQGSVHLSINALVECKTPPERATKEVAAVDGFAMIAGAILAVKFSYSNTAEAPRLSYAGNEMIILDRLTGKPIDPGDITAGVYHFQVSPTGWLLLDKQQSSGTATPVPGDKGEDGGYWAPSVADDGTLTWTPSKEGMGEAPAAANISGPPGKDGGYYIPKISQSGSNIMQLTFDPSEPGMTSVQARQIALPKGDPGQDGTSPTVAVATITGGHRLTITDAEGSKSADILDGVTPALQIGAVATLDPGSAATASITGTPAAPILNLGIPRGADAPASEAGVTSVNGQSGSVALALPGLGTCSSEASAQIKSISVSTAGFEARDGALLAVKFNNFPNTANGPVLEIGSKSYPVVSSASYNPPKAAALFKAVHLFILAGQAAILLDPADFAAAVEEGLAV